MIELDERYFERFSDTTPVELVPYDPRLDMLAQRYMQRLRSIVGPGPEIEHRGATALHMVGKGEIDLYVRVDRVDFPGVLEVLRSACGPPGSLELHRARFNDTTDGVEVEVMLVDRDHPEEQAGRLFFRYLSEHPDAVQEYGEVKQTYAPISRRAYYWRKYLFVRDILRRAGATP